MNPSFIRTTIDIVPLGGLINWVKKSKYDIFVCQSVKIFDDANCLFGLYCQSTLIAQIQITSDLLKWYNTNIVVQEIL